MTLPLTWNFAWLRKYEKLNFNFTQMRAWGNIIMVVELGFSKMHFFHHSWQPEDVGRLWVCILLWWMIPKRKNYETCWFMVFVLCCICFLSFLWQNQKPKHQMSPTWTYSHTNFDYFVEVYALLIGWDPYKFKLSVMVALALGGTFAVIITGVIVGWTIKRGF